MSTDIDYNITDNSITIEKINFATIKEGNVFLVDVNLFNPSTITNSAYIRTDGKTIYSGTSYVKFSYSDYIDVIEGETITFSDNQPLAWLMLYDSSNAFISTINGVGTNGTIKSIIIPTGVSKLRFNFDNTRVAISDYKVLATRTFKSENTFEMDSFRVNDNNFSEDFKFVKTSNIESIMKNISNTTSNWLYGKTLLAIGDSITDLTTPHKKYITLLSEEKEFNLINNGKSGSGFVREMNAGESLVNRIELLSNDVDVVLVFLGTNDFGYDIPLGASGDNISTFHGAVRYCFDKLIEKYPLKIIAIITPMPQYHLGISTNVLGYTIQDYSNVIKLEAEKRSFPLLNMTIGSNFNCNNALFRTTYTHNGDGLHPNDDWHKVLARKVGSFLERI